MHRRVLRYQPDGEDSRPLAFVEAKSPRVFGTGLEDFKKVAADLGDLRNPAVRDSLDELKMSSPRAKVQANGGLLCPKAGQFAPTAPSLAGLAAFLKAW